MALETSEKLRSLLPDRYLGLDPGLNRTGYALLCRTPQGPVLKEGGVICSTKSRTLAQRIHEIATGVRELLAEFRPEMVAIEQVFSTPQYPKTAVLMAHARGAILFAVSDFGVPIVHYAPTRIKRLLTGSGRADKTQIQRAIQRELRLSKLLEPNDVADASAVALCHYHSLRNPETRLSRPA